jgi:hypothetical protein
MKPDWRALALLPALLAAWAFAAFAPPCDGGRPRPAKLLPARLCKARPRLEPEARP